MIQIKITLHLLGPAVKENIEQVQRTKNRTLWETLRDISKNDCEERWLKTSRRSSQSSVSVTQNFLSCRPLFRQHTAGDLASLCQVAWKPGYDSSPSSVFLTSLPLINRAARISSKAYKPQSGEVHEFLLMSAPRALDVSFSLFSATILLTEKLLLFSSVNYCAWLGLLIGSYLPLATRVDSN